jgi:hypothetical protein
MNLFVAGAIESCGRICHTVDEVLAALREPPPKLPARAFRNDA